MAGCLVGRVAGWQVGWLAGWLVDRLASLLVARLAIQYDTIQYNTTLHRFVINTTWDSSELHFYARGDEDLEVARDAVRGTVLLAWGGKLHFS